MSLKGLFDPGYKELKRTEKIADKVLALASVYNKLTDEELKNKTVEFRERLKKGETLDDILVEAFATVREAATRVLHMTPFKVQVMGAAALHGGNIAEMKTGEGKTLTSTMVAYLNALPGEGVHIVTVNEYLASRDATEMGELFKWLGLTVGLNLRELSPDDKRAAYNCDITYTTNSEVGFDYLRDHMVIYKEQMVQRKLNYAIIDEVDSILIDEARTPLIISGGERNTGNLYQQADLFAKSLRIDDEGADYELDEKARNVVMTERGIEKAERFFKVENIYDVAYVNVLHHIHNALKANFVMKKDVEYVVADGKVVIVDSFTGRLMHGRQYSDGLHQALEAKEHVEIKKETRTIATITYQNYFRMYKKLSGMTGTAKTEEEEFRNIYNMFVICIPTNKDIARIDSSDLIYSTQAGKYKALISEIEERHKKGQPVLVGTIAIETNELISSMLTKRRIPHEVLNAKNHAREAEIIAKAGEKGAVTIATNMAGRGTDIKLTDETRLLGGLCVLGTERHESRRIDNQLRGRSGRQGDPGFTQFFVSMEDELMVRFGSDRIKRMMQTLGLAEDQPIQSKTFSSALSTAQTRVEGNNFDIRKQLLQYDDVMNNQREIMYGKRNEILDNESIHDVVLESIKNNVSDLVKSHLYPEGTLSKEDIKDIVQTVNEKLLKDDIDANDLYGLKEDEIIDFIYDQLVKEYEEKIEIVPKEISDEFEKVIMLNVIDKYWTEHINTMSHLREGIHLRSYGQTDPLRAYTVEGYEQFDAMMQKIDQEVTTFLLRAEVKQNIERKEVSKNKITNDGKDAVKTAPKKSKKVGRNDQCPCGSGKKYKQCCGK